MKKKTPSTPRAGRPANGMVLSCRWGEHSRPVYRPTWVEINRSAFRANIRHIASQLNTRTGILAVVKANAYGHLAAPLARIALREGVAMLGVSSIEEGIALRENGIRGRILIMGSIYPFENLRACARYRLTPTISSLAGVTELAALGAAKGVALPFHLKIDTGMGRVGISPETAPAVLRKIAALRNVRMEGMYMHFAAADTDPAFTRRQITRMKRVVEYARGLGLRFTAHAANSAALLAYPEMHLDMVRPGISLYGLAPIERARRQRTLEPVLQWKTRIVFLKKVAAGTPVSYGHAFVTRRPSLIATLPVGYADGYPRCLSDRAEVLVRGRRCPVVGRVTMDMVMADVTGVRDAAIGDEVVLIGRQGGERISAEELAGRAKTINYEITCGISYRVPRVLT